MSGAEGAIKDAIEYLGWLTHLQPKGYMALLAIPERPNGRKGPTESCFIHNRNARVRVRIRQFVKPKLEDGVHLFYSVNAFKEPEAKAVNVERSRIAHVDADNVSLPPNGPKPSRIIQTSPRNYQFLYVLDEFVTRQEIERISAYLTRLVGGDRGGHSAAKLLRIPGTLNIKSIYDEPYLVRVLQEE